MYNIVVMDCDLISSFAKINRIDLLETLFPDAQLVITPSVYNELLKTKEYGFDFLDKIIGFGTLLSNQLPITPQPISASSTTCHRRML